ncbi:hypothetical protein DSECCO2_526950 [anaerobic digester metagenome]
MADEAARVAMPGFWLTLPKSSSGSFPERYCNSFAASSGCSLSHCCCIAFLWAAEAIFSFRFRAYHPATSGKTANGSSGFPPRLAMDFSKEAPDSPSGMPWVAHLRSKLSPSAVSAPLPITVFPMIRVGRSCSSWAASSAARMAE